MNTLLSYQEKCLRIITIKQMN